MNNGFQRIETWTRRSIKKWFGVLYFIEASWSNDISDASKSTESQFKFAIFALYQK